MVRQYQLKDRVSLVQACGKQLLVAFGANQSFGEMLPDALVLNAIQEVGEALNGTIRPSGLFSSPCFPAGAGPDYVNAAAVVTLRHDSKPQQLLQVLHDVEARFGRNRSTRWASRTLDIDLLAIDQMVMPDPDIQSRWRNLPVEDQMQETPDQLILPHPRLQDRAFVLVPLAEVAPDWAHPALGLTVTQMLAALPLADRAAVVRLNSAASF